MKQVSLIIFCILMLSFFSGLAAGAAEDDFEILSIDTFAGGDIFEKSYKFTTVDRMDNSLTLEIIKRSNVTAAQFNVTSGSTKGEFCKNPMIDVGDDGDYEWAYTGVGYGRFGYQNEFSTGRTEQLVFVPNTGTSKEIAIKLPKNSNIHTANMTVLGTSVSDSSYNAEQYIITQDRSTRVSYVESNLDGSFDTMETMGRMTSYWGDHGVGIADFDNDGDLDYVLITSSLWNQPKPVYLLKKAGSGRFFEDKTLAGEVTTSSNGQDIGLGDFDNDKDVDFFACGWGQSTGRLFWNQGTGTFATEDFDFGMPYTTGKDAEDIDEDGDLDMILVGGTSTSSMTVHWYQNNGDGTFGSKKDLSIGNAYIYGLVADDFDGDTHVDILTGESDGKWYITRGNGDGTFGSTQYTGLDVGGNHPGYGDTYDFNFDGKMDLICSSDYSAGNIKYYEGNGDGTFRFPVDIGSAGSNVAGIAGPPHTSIGSPLDLELDLGDDGSNEWSTSGEFTTEVTLTGLAQKINTFLQNTNETYLDAYGNVMVDVPIKLTGTSPGNVILKNLEIEFEFTATVEKNPHNGDLATELNELIPFYEEEYNLNVTIPILVKSETAGWMKLSDLFIEYRAPNKRPSLSIPRNTYWLYEDSGRHKNFIDMDIHSSDDRWPEGAGELRYEIIQHSQPEGLQAIIHSHYMDVLPSKNFFGRVEFRIKVIDNGNDAIPGTADDLYSLSNFFNITVLPQNDAPTVLHIGGYDSLDTLLQFNATEGEQLDLIIEAADIDNDPVFPLKFNWEFQDGDGKNIRNKMNLDLATSTYFNDSGLEITRTTLSYIPDQYEVDLGSVYVTLTVTDNNGTDPLNDIVQFVIRVVNVNDAPTILPIGSYYAVEDSLLRITVYASDEDGDILTFYTNRSDNQGNDDIETFNIDPYKGVITFVPRNDNIGYILIRVYVDDGAGETNSIVSRSFQILVNNTNDPPGVNKITYDIIDLNPNTPEVKENLEVTFTTTEPHDDDLIHDDYLTYEWDFDANNGFQIQAEGMVVNWTYDNPGKYEITLRVRDSKGATNSTSIPIRVFKPEIVEDNDNDNFTDGEKVKSILASPQAMYFMLVFIIIGIIIIGIASVIIKRRKDKVSEEEENVVPFSDKELKVCLPEDVARDLATKVRLEKGIYKPPKELKVPLPAKNIIEHSDCSTPAECRPAITPGEEVHVSLPASASGAPAEAVPAQLPPAPEEVGSDEAQKKEEES